MRGIRLIKRSVHDKWRKLLKLNFAIATSQPCGETFRLDFGITIPVVLVLMVLAYLSGLS